MEKNSKSASISKQKISLFGWTQMEIFKILVVALFMEHPVDDKIRDTKAGHSLWVICYFCLSSLVSSERFNQYNFFSLWVNNNADIELLF